MRLQAINEADMIFLKSFSLQRMKSLWKFALLFLVFLSWRVLLPSTLINLTEHSFRNAFRRNKMRFIHERIERLYISLSLFGYSVHDQLNCSVEKPCNIYPLRSLIFRVHGKSSGWSGKVVTKLDCLFLERKFWRKLKNKWTRTTSDITLRMKVLQLIWWSS